MIDCEDIIRKAIGRDMSDADIDEFFQQAERLQKQAEAMRKASGLLLQIDKLSADWKQKEQLAALANKRNTVLQILKRNAVLDFCMKNFKGMEIEGLQALQAGSRYLREGSRLSVGEAANALGNSYMGQLVIELGGMKGALFKLFTSGEMDRQIAEAMFSIGKGIQYNGPKEAMEIGQAIHKIQERARMDANRAGAWIGNLPGYIVRQSHDPARLNKAGFQKWRQNIESKLDWDLTAGGRIDPVANPEAAREFLFKVYHNLVSGYHLHTVHNSNPLATNSNIGSTAAHLSQERVLHFKSGGDWFDYHNRFGRGNLGSAVTRGLQQNASATALMQTFGPSPKDTIKWVIDKMVDQLKKRGDSKGLKRIDNMKKKIKENMGLLDGTANMDGNIRAAEIARNVRAIGLMARLGGAVISSITDVPNLGFEFAYQGQGFFKGIAKTFQYFLRGRPSLEQQKIAAQCGVFFDGILGNIAARFSDDAVSGKVAAAMNVFFKLNLLTFWTDNWKKSFVLAMSNGLADMRRQAWKGLNRKNQRLFGSYGIGEREWDVIRKSAVVLADGKDYLTPEGVLDLPDTAIEAYLKPVKKEISPGMIMATREELASKLRTLYRDRVHYAVLEPDVANRRFMYQGTSSGTAVGEALRFIMQFKSFPTLFVQRTMAREIYGRGADSIGKGLGQIFRKSDGGDRSNFATMFLAMTGLGILAMQAKAIVAGKNPRPFFDKNYWWKTTTAGMLQGGGLGIMGDFFFGDYSRMGTGPIASSLGPTAGNIDALGRIIAKLRSGDIDVGPQSLQLLMSNIPYNNLFYTKWALDYYLLHQVNEKLRPGYIERMKKRIKKDNGQTFWLDPAK